MTLLQLQSVGFTEESAVAGSWSPKADKSSQLVKRSEEHFLLVSLRVGGWNGGSVLRSQFWTGELETKQNAAMGTSFTVQFQSTSGVPIFAGLQIFSIFLT